MIITSSTPGAAAAVSQDWQVDFDGLVLGAGTPYGLTKWGGFLDMPSVRTQDSERPQRDGMFLGANFDGGKIYDLEFDVVTDGLTTFADAVANLEGGTYTQSTLRPLRFKLPGRALRVVLVQCRKRAIPVEIAYQFGMSQSGALQFYAPDSRQYGISQSQSTGLRFGGTGLTYPMVYPLSYGAPPSGGRITFINTGPAPTEPVITVSGPFAAGFEVTYIETGQRLRYEKPVGTDLVLDNAEGTVTTQGQERGPNLTVREWFSVPGNSTATFALATLGSETSVTAPTAGMTVAAAPAYL